MRINNWVKNHSPTILDYLLVLLALSLSGIFVGYLVVTTETHLDNIAVPLIILVVSALLFAKPSTTEIPKQSHAQPSSFSLGATAVALIVLVISLFIGMELAKSRLSSGLTTSLQHDISESTLDGSPTDFSFIVFGDTRTELHIPWREPDSARIDTLLKKRFPYLDGSLIATKTFDLSGELVDLIVPGPAGGKTMSDHYKYNAGWPITIHRHTPAGVKSIYHKSGHERIYTGVARYIQRVPTSHTPESVDFCIHTGDLVLWSDGPRNPYWNYFRGLFYDDLSQRGLDERVFPVIGNHEYWRDPTADNFFKIFRHLSPEEPNTGYHYYSFEYGKCVFVFLCSGWRCTDGGYSECWNCAQASFSEQMSWMMATLNRARHRGVKHVFVTYHKPSFSHSEHRPLVDSIDPRRYLEQFLATADGIDITVFNGHNHTTEFYVHKGIRYLVLGGGGAPQCLVDKSYPCQPKERFWDSAAKRERYNFLRVDVAPNGLRFHEFFFQPADSTKGLQHDDVTDRLHAVSRSDCAGQEPSAFRHHIEHSGVYNGFYV